MASKRWVGGAPEIAQVQTFLFGGTWEANDLIRVSFANGKTKDFTAGSTTTNTVVSNLAIAWNALDSDAYPEFGEITASANTATLTLTADAAGIPFTVTLTPLESNGGAADAQTIEGAGTATTGTTATANSGPHDFSLAANWDTNTAPAAADDLYFDNSDVDCLYRLDFLTGETLTSVNIAASYTGKIGLLQENNNGYPEYRAKELTCEITTLGVGYGPGTGSSRIKINGEAVQSAVTVYSTGSSEDPNLPTVQWRGTHASNTVSVLSGSVGIGVYNAQSAVIATLRVVDGDVRSGLATTLTTIHQSGGSLETWTAATTVIKSGGTFTANGGAHGTVTNHGGDMVYKSNGTITTLTVGAGASVDFSRDIRDRTVTTCTLHAGATLLDPFDSVTFTNGIVLSRCKLADVTLDLGFNRTLTPS